MSGPSENFALESEGLASVSSRPAGRRSGKSSLMTLTGLCLPSDFLTPASLKTYLTRQIQGMQ